MRKGFTLIELLLTVLMMSGAVVWLLHNNYMSLRAAEDAHLRFLITKGVLLYEVERLQNQPFADLDVEGPTATTQPVML